MQCKSHDFRESPRKNVESTTGAVAVGRVAVADGFRDAGASAHAMAPFPVAARRTQRADFPRSRTRSCRPRKVTVEASELVVCLQLRVRVLPGPHLVLAHSHEPPGRVSVHRCAGVARAEVSVITVQAPDDDLRFQETVAAMRCHPAGCLNARLARAGADIGTACPDDSCVQSGSPGTQWAPRALGSIGSSRH